MNCATCDSLSAALREALILLYVQDKHPPYRVPSAIDHDLWKFTEASDKPSALVAIRRAVDNVRRTP